MRGHGVTGAASPVRQYVRAWRTGPRPSGRRRRAEDAASLPPRRRRFSPAPLLAGAASRRARRAGSCWILLRPVAELDADEQAHRPALAGDFGPLVRARAHTEREAWLAAAKRRISDLVSCARGRQRDRDAATAALRSPSSHGQTEGHVN